MKDGAKNSQIWLLGENDDNVLRGQVISTFRMREDSTGDYYPREINIMLISLPRLAQEKGLYGNLSTHILDGNVDELDGELNAIAEMFKQEFGHFKNDEEVIKEHDDFRGKVFRGHSDSEEKTAAVYNAIHESI